MREDGECPDCNAPVPVHGLIEHAWDCGMRPALRPLKSLSEKEKIDLLALAIDMEEQRIEKERRRLNA